MKPYINFLIFVLVAIALYTVYGMLTFQQDEPKPFLFSEPKLPVEFIQMDETKENPADLQQKTAAVEDSEKALAYYRDAQAKVPAQAKDTVSLLVSSMANSDLPLYFLSGPNEQKGNIRSFEMLKLNSSSVAPSAVGAAPSLNCSTHPIVLGTAGKDTINCGVNRQTKGGSVDNDFIFIGGPENDSITDATGNRIINGGTGDDTIKLGVGRSIIVLDASWGKDTLTVDCAGASISPNEIPPGFSIPWVAKTTNFIVLANSINPKDVEWRGNVLTHKVTGDTLTVNQNCFTVVPAL